MTHFVLFILELVTIISEVILLGFLWWEWSIAHIFRPSLTSSGQGCTTSTAMAFSPWIAIVSQHVLSWVFPGCLLTAVFSRPYSEWNCRDVSTFKKWNFYPLLKWQTGVWSLQLCHCEFAAQTLYDCFHFVLGSIWTPVHTIVQNLSRKLMNNEPKVTETIEALCGAVSWTCRHDVLLWSCVMNMSTWRAFVKMCYERAEMTCFCRIVSWTCLHDVQCVELCHKLADYVLLWSCVMNIEHTLQEILPVRNNSYAHNFDITLGIRRACFIHCCEICVHLGK